MNDDVPATVRDLIARVADGDQRAFAQLYDLTAPNVLAITTAVLRDTFHAQEVTQEVYLEIWRNARRFNPDLATDHLIRHIARRRAIDRVRAVQADRERDHRHALENRNPPDDAAERAEIRLSYAPIAAAIRQLPQIHRDVLVLAYIRGYTHSEIAAELLLPLGTVKTRLRDSLRRLRTQLQADESPNTYPDNL